MCLVICKINNELNDFNHVGSIWLTNFVLTDWLATLCCKHSAVWKTIDPEGSMGKRMQELGH